MSMYSLTIKTYTEKVLAEKWDDVVHKVDRGNYELIAETEFKRVRFDSLSEWRDDVNERHGNERGFLWMSQCEARVKLPTFCGIKSFMVVNLEPVA